MTTFMAIVLWVILPALILITVLNWVLETHRDRAQRWHKSGMPKAEIARRLGVSRYRVNKLLTATA